MKKAIVAIISLGVILCSDIEYFKENCEPLVKMLSYFVKKSVNRNRVLMKFDKNTALELITNSKYPMLTGTDSNLYFVDLYFGSSQIETKTAVKVFTILKADYQQEQTNARNELSTLLEIKSKEKMLQMHGCFYEETETDFKLFILQEPMISEVTRYHLATGNQNGIIDTKIIDNFHKLDFSERLNVYKDILEQMLILHNLNIAHGDLNPNKLMFANEGGTKVKIIDFGSVRSAEESNDFCFGPMDENTAIELNNKRIDLVSVAFSIGAMEINEENVSDQFIMMMEAVEDQIYPKQSEFMEYSQKRLEEVEHSTDFQDCSFVNFIRTLTDVKNIDVTVEQAIKWIDLIQEGLKTNANPNETPAEGNGICKQTMII